METVVLQSLSKTYSGGKLAVRQVSLSLNQGEVFGFLGPNGAGKTTTVKLLNGMLSPTGAGRQSRQGTGKGSQGIRCPHRACADVR